MGSITLVERQLSDGQRFLSQLARDGFGVVAGFWLKESPEDWWHLYVAAKGVEEAGTAVGYRALQTSLSKFTRIDLSLADLKLLDASHPMARVVAAMQKHHPDLRPIRLSKGQLGGENFEEAWIYPSLPRKRSPHDLGERRLKTAVERSASMDDLLSPLTPEETQALGQLLAAGVSPDQADYWIRKKREQDHPRTAIPAGSVVKARVAAWWGDLPQDDPNPLLEVEAEDGARGLTFQNNTEPV